MVIGQYSHGVENIVLNILILSSYSEYKRKKLFVTHSYAIYILLIKIIRYYFNEYQKIQTLSEKTA